MPKFKILKSGANPALINKTRTTVKKFLLKMIDKDELIEIDDIISFKFGTVMVQARVLPYHEKDCLVEVFSYLAEKIKYNSTLGEKLLRLNATLHIGAFGVTFDNSIVFTYSIAGANLDFNELLAAVQTVATVADAHDELVLEMVG